MPTPTNMSVSSTLNTNPTPNMPSPTALSPSSTPIPTSGPLDLSTIPYERPHLIIPIDKSKPDASFGNQFIAKLSPTQSSLFNFDVRPEFAGKTCNLIFQLPAFSETWWWQPFELRSPGGISVSQLEKVATDKSSWNTAGDSRFVGGVDKLEHGKGHVISSFPCEAGKTVSYRVDPANGLDLQYFQMVSPASGLFMTASG